MHTDMNFSQFTHDAVTTNLNCQFNSSQIKEKWNYCKYLSIEKPQEYVNFVRRFHFSEINDWMDLDISDEDEGIYFKQTRIWLEIYMNLWFLLDINWAISIEKRSYSRPNLIMESQCFHAHINIFISIQNIMKDIPIQTIQQADVQFRFSALGSMNPEYIFLRMIKARVAAFILVLADFLETACGAIHQGWRGIVYIK